MRGFFLSSKVYCSGTSNNLGVLSMKPPAWGGGGGGGGGREVLGINVTCSAGIR